MASGGGGSNRRHLYETAFVDNQSSTKSDDGGGDETDHLANHPLLRQVKVSASASSPALVTKAGTSPVRPSPAKVVHQPSNSADVASAAMPFTRQIQKLRQCPPTLTTSQTPPPSLGTGVSPSPPPLRCSPPSTAPLPIKFRNGRGMSLNVPNSGESNLSSLESLQSCSSEMTSSSSISSRHETSSLSSSSAASFSSSFGTSSEARPPSSASSTGSYRPRHSFQHLTLSSHHRHQHHQHATLHLLSPISDRSQEPTSEASSCNAAAAAATGNFLSSAAARSSQKTSPEDNADVLGLAVDPNPPRHEDGKAQNRLSLVLGLQQKNDFEIQGSDSGISVESKGRIKKKQSPSEPTPASGEDDDIQLLNNMSVELPFDMPKLRRKLSAANMKKRPNFRSKSLTKETVVQVHEALQMEGEAHQSLSVAGETDAATSTRPKLKLGDIGGAGGNGNGKRRPMGIVRPSLSLDFGQAGSKSSSRSDMCLDLGFSGLSVVGACVDPELPLEKQGWYHGSLSRTEAENTLRESCEGSYLVRRSGGHFGGRLPSYSLAIKTTRGFIHVRLDRLASGRYRVGDGSSFASIPALVHHYSSVRLPLRGARHLSLLHPVIEQLL